MVRLVMHVTRPAGESGLEWHRRSWRAAMAAPVSAWGADPVTTVVTCVVSGVRRMVPRPTCSMAGRVLRWRSAADAASMRTLAGGRLGCWSRSRRSKPPAFAGRLADIGPGRAEPRAHSPHRRPAPLGRRPVWVGSGDGSRMRGRRLREFLFSVFSSSYVGLGALLVTPLDRRKVGPFHPPIMRGTAESGCH